MTIAPLPAPLSRFVGRKDALAELGSYHARGARLVTVWGPAGMGKTRLAIEAARARKAAGDSVLFVPLAETAEIGAACGAVGRACGALVAGDADATLVDLAGRALAAKGPVLLVLDNVEQLLPDLAPALQTWLERAPTARLLVTSRERTRIAGEAAMELSPVATEEAVELFFARVNEHRPADPLDEASTPRVAELVRALEGIPLAIELAAARFDVLGIDGLLSRLAKRLDLLGRPRRAGDPRTTTLRGAIEWSWSLLPDDERLALARCSVFPASFSIDAAAHVLADLPASAIDLVQALRDKSLLRLAPSEGGIGPSRFSLYEGVRELGAEKLAHMRGEAALAARLHAEHFLALGETLTGRLARTGDVSALTAIARESEHFIAIAARAPESLEALRALTILDPVVTTRGPTTAHEARLDVALRAAERGGADPILFARAIGSRGRLRTLRGRAEDAERDLERALSLAVVAGDRLLEAELLADLGVLWHRRGDLLRAQGLYERALEVDRAAGGSRTEGRVLGNLGAVHHDAHRHALAIEHYERALSILTIHGDHRLLGIVSTNLGLLTQEQGSMSAARRRFDRAAALLAEAGDLRLLGITLTNLGLLHHEEGRLEDARFCHEQALQKLVVAGDRRSEGLAFVRLGALLASLGRLDEARVALHRGERAAGESDPLVLGAAAVASGFLELSLARRAREERRPEAAAAHLSKATDRIRDARAGSPGEPSAADRSDDVRTLVRILERGVSALSAGSAASPARPTSSAGSAASSANVGPSAGSAASSAHVGPSAGSAASPARPATSVGSAASPANVAPPAKTSAPSEGDPQRPDERSASTAEGAPDAALLLAPEIRWLRAPGSPWRDLRRRGPARRLLAHLVERQREAPGAGVSLDDLRDAGWPGERMTPASAANRIYVALHQLRGLGLGDRVIRTQDGYLLDPTLPVYHVAIEPFEEGEGPAPARSGR